MCRVSFALGKTTLKSRLLFLFVAAAFACLFIKDVAAAQFHKAPVRRFKVTFRVVRPQWREQPSTAEAETVPYSVIMGIPKALRNPASDTEFLELVRKANPKFTFDRVQAKITTILKADQKWNQPPGFSMNKMSFAIVDTNRDLLIAKIPPANGSTYKASYSDQQMKQIQANHQVLLSYYTEQYYRENSNMKLFLASDLFLIADNNSSPCLTHMVKFLKRGNKAALPVMDVIFVSFSEMSAK